MKRLVILALAALTFGCSKKEGSPTPPVPQENFGVKFITINGIAVSGTPDSVDYSPLIKISFTAPVNRGTATGILLNTSGGASVSYTAGFENNDSTVTVRPSSPLASITRYNLTVSTSVTSKNNKSLQASATASFITAINPSDKFPRITDNELLDLVQRQTFKYFWDFAHPVSGLARERNTSGDLVTSGGSGFGIMSIITGIHRQFISRAEGRARMQKIVGFLKNNAQRFHGAFPHWLNGSTGAVIPFSTKDNGADLVETSYLMQGLLAARQYFDGSDAVETTLRNDINTLWNEVEWSRFRRNGENVLYWHWSPNYFWEMNHPIRGWNECLITYVLAASSTTHSIPKIVYDNGWAQNGAMRNNGSFFGYNLPLGPPYGGPLFFAHYSFLGINPNNLTDTYANYWEQNRNHTLINYTYCKNNPRGHTGYSDSCWGLTASDDHLTGYMAHEPMNDNGVIAPTAALSSFPYTPAESMQALKYFYYKLGDRMWKEYGFIDAFSIKDAWFAESFLAIDQGPIIVMIENYRSGLLWNLFMSCPEVKAGMRNLGFQSPHL
ncbi:MAG TPA: glucoamylase family protein [Flavisolibacter sp.]|jgi:hypothetical protein